MKRFFWSILIKVIRSSLIAFWNSLHTHKCTHSLIPSGNVCSQKWWRVYSSLLIKARGLCTKLRALNFSTDTRYSGSGCCGAGSAARSTRQVPLRSATRRVIRLAGAGGQRQERRRQQGPCGTVWLSVRQQHKENHSILHTTPALSGNNKVVSSRGQRDASETYPSSYCIYQTGQPETQGCKELQTNHILGLAARNLEVKNRSTRTQLRNLFMVLFSKKEGKENYY